MRVGLIYTGVTPELKDFVEREVLKQLGSETEFYTLTDPSIIQEANDVGYVTPQAAARLVTMYCQAIQNDVEAILNLCSSVGEVADSMQPFANFTNIPIVRIDEEMCREAVRSSDRVAVMATLKSTLKPTVRTIQRLAKEVGKKVDIEEILVEGAFGIDQEEFKTKLSESAHQASPLVDSIVLAQGSMAYAEASIEAATGKRVLSSPSFGAKALKDALGLKSN